MRIQNQLIVITLFLFLLPVIGYIHLSSGHISVSNETIFKAIFDFNSTDLNQLIVHELRLPRLLIACIAGAGLSIAGLLMQTLFNNPLAGPYVLGINSGASLFVAFSMMTGIPFLFSDLGIVSSALIGAFLFGIIILFFSAIVRSHISLLLIGIMLGSFTSAIVYILQSLSSSQELKSFVMWSMGSLQNVELTQIPIISGLFLIGLIGSFLLIKPLNVLVIGESEARLLGIKFKYVRLLIILITALLTGLITAYCGPIAFIGLAIPNLIRLLFKTQNHGILIISCALVGALFLISCDIIIQSLENHVLIPINAFTSLLGAPFVVLIVLKRLT